jgi:thiamine monophosphate synthase
VTAVAGLARTRGVPVVAIGGITLARAPAVLAAGAAAVCVISDLLVDDPGRRAREFLAALGPGGSAPPGRPRVN